MKDFIKVFLLIAGAFLFYFSLSQLSKINPFVLTMLSILASVIIIGGGILLFRNKWSHRIPKEKRNKYWEKYKNQFRNKK